MKDNLIMEPVMETEDTYMLMELFILGTLLTIRQMDLENTRALKGIHIKVSGNWIFLMAKVKPLMLIMRSMMGK